MNRQLPSLGNRCAEVYASIVDQLRTVVSDAGFTSVVLGISGGLDSALVATMAVDALGATHVEGVLMPSPYSSEGSVVDAAELAGRLGIKTHTVPITPAYETFNTMLEPHFEGRARDVTEENLQARIRGIILMAFSNKFGHYVLATGNKSEALAGYATLYGDMVGAWAPLAPLYKTWVYELAKWRNTQGDNPVIPDAILLKEPSAELSHGQLDRHALGDYASLDAIFSRVVDEGLSSEELYALGFDLADVERAQALIAGSAFKRGFAAPGPTL